MDIGTLSVDKTRNARDDTKLLRKQALDPVRALTHEFRVNQQETATTARVCACQRYRRSSSWRMG